MRTIASVLWWLSIVTWCAAIVAPGAAAISSFTRLPAIEATMPGIDSFFAGDPGGAGRFVAGYVTNPIFIASDSACLASAIIAAVALVLGRLRPCGDGPAGRIAVIAVAIAGVVLAWYLWRVSPGLADSLGDWRQAVLADDRPAAEAAWSRFDPLHKTASRLLGIQFTMLMVAVVAGAIAARKAGKVTGS